MVELDLIYDAAFALDALSRGDDPGYAVIVSGISALEALQESPSSLEPAPYALVEGAHRLLNVATECDLPLDADSRTQAARLAHGLRQTVSSSRT